jgi:hypothetical protein
MAVCICWAQHSSECFSCYVLYNHQYNSGKVRAKTITNLQIRTWSMEKSRHHVSQPGCRWTGCNCHACMSPSMCSELLCCTHPARCFPDNPMSPTCWASAPPLSLRVTFLHGKVQNASSLEVIWGTNNDGCYSILNYFLSISQFSYSLLCINLLRLP